MGMTIGKAIEILDDSLKGQWPTPNSDLNVATRLGSEALKQVKESRFDPSTWEPKLLPGETKE